ncbi:hypothetical protein [Paracoccus nototheniae]|uniref:Uncharacterized protein n=1 Tax=Paracoccus nototheniae TaxID=2489002 RepID=A0ABW4DZ28_9RHOB|nr:hypothetical protein [Paracoccus nototheniae]
MTPAAKRMLRNERRRERDGLRGRLGKDRSEAIVAGLRRIMRHEFVEGRTATLFGLEGPMRHAMRETLCLQGWQWADADDTARQLVAAALASLWAIRPTWNEGQPEWTIEQGTLIARTRCARCQAPLPEGHYKFCSRLCSTAFNSWLSNMRRAEESNVMQIAARMG